MADYEIERDGVRLGVSDNGEGIPVVLLHGLTATRRYVVMGSRALERSGHRVIAYDARGHGTSSPATDPESGYSYGELGLDLEAVLDGTGVESAVLAGASMGAHTLLWLALNRPERARGLVVITPAYDGRPTSPERLARWDALAAGLEEGGVGGFVEAYGEPAVPPQWRDTVLKVIEQRLSQHRDPQALADAIRGVPRSEPFGEIGELAAIGVPTTVVASGDEADPEHPFAIGEAYARTIPGARLVTDEPGSSPIAWQGSQLSRVIAEVAATAEGAG